MCLIIQKPAGMNIPQWIVESAYKRNSDGFGLMAYNKARQKPIMLKFKDRTTKQIEELLGHYTEQEIAVHFRMATHGEVSQELAHPFRLADNSLLMHNGILSAYCPTERDGRVSDTSKFCAEFMNTRIEAHREYLRSEDSEREITKAIGSSNALAIMHTDGALKLYGSRWLSYEGMQFSNSYAWDCPVYGKTSYTSSWDDDDYSQDYVDGSKYSIMEAVGNEVLEILYIYADSFDFSDYRLFSTADMGLADDYASGLLSAVDILNEADEYSLLNMYKELAKQGII